MSSNHIPNQQPKLSKRASNPNIKKSKDDKKINEKIIKSKIKAIKTERNKKITVKNCNDEMNEDLCNDHPSFLNAIDLPESTFDGKIKVEDLTTISEPIEADYSDEIANNNISTAKK